MKVDLGINSVSLTVKDIVASKAFYEKLGFEQLTEYGSVEEKWVIMKNGDCKIGLFQDMFPKNTLTFNPTDARAIQKHLKSEGVKLDVEADETTAGPCHLMLTDPDGNPILIDQHF